MCYFVRVRHSCGHSEWGTVIKRCSSLLHADEACQVRLPYTDHFKLYGCRNCQNTDPKSHQKILSDHNKRRFRLQIERALICPVNPKDKLRTWSKIWSGTPWKIVSPRREDTLEWMCSTSTTSSNELVAHHNDILSISVDSGSVKHSLERIRMHQLHSGIQHQPDLTVGEVIAIRTKSTLGTKGFELCAPTNTTILILAVATHRKLKDCSDISVVRIPALTSTEQQPCMIDSAVHDETPNPKHIHKILSLGDVYLDLLSLLLRRYPSRGQIAVYLDAQAEFELHEPVSRRTALQSAVRSQHMDVIELLLNKRPDAQCDAAHIVLSCAVLLGHMHLVDSLIQAGADLNWRDEATGLKPLHYAILSRSPGMTRVLIEHGARVHMDDDQALEGPEYRWVSRVIFDLAWCMDYNNVTATPCKETTRKDAGSKRNEVPATSRSGVATTANQGQAPGWIYPDLNSSDEDEDQRKRREGPSVTEPPEMGADLGEDRKFACPYMKFDPTRYGNQKCCGSTGYESIPRLKEHLYKKHRICEVCRKTFADEDLLQEHIANDCVGSTPKPPKLSDGFVASQAHRMKPRWKNLKPAEKWFKIYRILFEICESDTTPSPYFETRDQLQRENRRLRNEGNRRDEEIARLLNENERLRRDNEQFRRNQGALASQWSPSQISS